MSKKNNLTITLAKTPRSKQAGKSVSPNESFNFQACDLQEMIKEYIKIVNEKNKQLEIRKQQELKLYQDFCASAFSPSYENIEFLVVKQKYENRNKELVKVFKDQAQITDKKIHSLAQENIRMKKEIKIKEVFMKLRDVIVDDEESSKIADRIAGIRKKPNSDQEILEILTTQNFNPNYLEICATLSEKICKILNKDLNKRLLNSVYK